MNQKIKFQNRQEGRELMKSTKQGDKRKKLNT